MTENKQVYIYTLSDSTGETVQGLARAVAVQFDNAIQSDWTLIKTSSQVEQICENLDSNSVVLYTLVDEVLVSLLKKICQKKAAGHMSAMLQFTQKVKSHGGKRCKDVIVGQQHALDDEYFARVAAIDFAVVHDDGQTSEHLGRSDVILVGVSRTSKSPTSFYLANRGIKTSNVPFVSVISLPETLFNVNKDDVLIVGLTRDAESLVNIRRSRLFSLNEIYSTDYVDIKKVEKEVLELKRLCGANGWPVINIGNKSIEETATQVIKYLDRLRLKRKEKEELESK